MKTLGRLVALLAGTVYGLSAGPILFSIAGLGIFPGGSMSSGGGVSSNGLATGNGDTTDLNTQAFLWQAGTLTNIGPAGSFLAYGNGVNSSGQVAGYAFGLGLGTYNAFLFDGSNFVAIAPLAAGANNAATGINDAGTVVGYSEDSSGDLQAFQYAAASVTPLGTMAGDSTSRANGINSSGSIVGSGDTYAFLYSGGSFTNLGALVGYVGSQGNAISDSGAVAGMLIDNDSLHTAFLWTPGSGMIALGMLGPSGSDAFGVNSSGWVVGTSNSSAFLYANSTMYDLSALLDATGAGWQLQDAMAINDQGQIIGTGVDPRGEQEAFMLTPDNGASAPEPATWLAVFTSLGVLAAHKIMRRRHRV